MGPWSLIQNVISAVITATISLSSLLGFSNVTINQIERNQIASFTKPLKTETSTSTVSADQTSKVNLKQGTTPSSVPHVGTTSDATAVHKENVSLLNSEQRKQIEEFKKNLISNPDVAAGFTPYVTPKLQKNTDLLAVLDSLRGSSPSSVPRALPTDHCKNDTNESSSTHSTLTPSPGINFTFDSVESQINYKDVETYIELHAYDSKGGHIGIPPADPKSPLYPYSYPEERSGYWYKMSFSYRTLLSLNELDDAKLVIKGKSFDTVLLQVRGEGNGCGITDEIEIPVTPYTIVTIPVSHAGDLGPIREDLNGDGISDIDISLVYELSNEQKDLLLEAIKLIDKLK